MVAIQTQTFVEQKQTNTSPQVIIVPYTSTKDVIHLHFKHGINLNVLYINHFTHQCERQSQLKFKGVVDIHLVSTGSQNVYYLVVWSETEQRHRCSCYDFRRSGQCQHCEGLPRQEAVIA